MIARFYDSRTGFTSLISIGSKLGTEDLGALRQVPHYVYEDSYGYDGAYYVQIALDPLLRQPDLKASVDNLSYRAKRILMSWLAWGLGAGKPAWIVQVYPLINIASWLILAWILLRWFPPDSFQNLLRWGGVMFCHGLCMSVRHSLVDGPGLLLVAGAVAMIEKGRVRGGTLLLSAAVLTKETSALAVPALIREWPSRRAQWFRIICQVLLVLAPLAVWMLYIRLQLGPARQSGINNFTLPLMGYFEKLFGLGVELARDGWIRPLSVSLLTVIALTVQAGVLLLRWQPGSIWWRVGAPFALLLAIVSEPVWEGYPGAATRVVLPLTLAFNVLLPRGRKWLPLLLAGNLSVVAGIVELAPPVRDFYRLEGDAQVVSVKRGEGWYQAESDENYAWRWGRDRAELRLTNHSRRPVEVRLTAQLAGITNRHFGFKVNGRQIFDTPLWRRGQRHEFPSFMLPPGTTTLEFLTDLPPVRLSNGDPREMSLSVSNLVITVVQPEGVLQR